MENTTVVERALPRTGADQAPPFPDVDAVVLSCISPDMNAFSVEETLTGITARAEEDIPRLDGAQAFIYVKCLSRIAKGLRRNTEEHQASRYFCFGQFQTRVDMLEQELERSRFDTQILAVANRKHFAVIMQTLYTEQVCPQQELSDKLNVDRSNLSKEMKRLEDSGLVESRLVGHSRFYQLTPWGRRYYNTYLVMKSHLEEQVYSPQGKDSKEVPPQHFTFELSDIQSRFLLNSWKDEHEFADQYIKSRPKLVIGRLGEDF